MKISKLFDISNNNKTISLANFVIFLEKNIRFFNQQDKILNIIKTYKNDFENMRGLLTKLKDHRDKCLAHNDVINECRHLEEMTSKDTTLILKIIFDFIFSLNNILDKKTIDHKLVQEIKDTAMKHNYILLKQLEADVY